LFLAALERNQVAFVKLFLDHDFSLTDLFRHNDKLLLLYLRVLQEVSIDEPNGMAIRVFLGT
jgi:hypothetical protein